MHFKQIGMQANVKKTEAVEAKKNSVPVIPIWTDSLPKKLIVVEQYHHIKAKELFNNERIFHSRKYDFY